MPRFRAWPPLEPLDWIVVSNRWYWLAAIPLVAGFTGVLSPGIGILVTVWAVLSILATLARGVGMKEPLVDWVVGALDEGIAVGVIVESGLEASPLWWAVLLGVAGVGLTRGRLGTIIMASCGGSAAAILTLLLSGVSPENLVTVSVNLLVLGVSTYGLVLLTERVRPIAKEMWRRQEQELERVREKARDRSRMVFQLAAALNATLSYKDVLEMALDVSDSALRESSDPSRDSAVSAILLFGDEGLRMASSRGMPRADRRVNLPGEEGAIAEAMSRGTAQLVPDPQHDPELKSLAGLHRCGSCLCIPLSAGFQAFGVLVLGHSDPDYFIGDRLEVLEAIGEQATVAIQNARLYHDLEMEKERITELQEEARKKLARDLHDGPTQAVAAITMRVNFARRLMERDTKAAADELFKVEGLARRTTKEIRHMLFTLRPLILESQGLVAALFQLAEKMRHTHGREVLVDAASSVAEDLEVGKQGVVFYIAEEAINNARKHAEAEHIWVRLKRLEDLFVLEVEDDGVGFNVGAVDTDYAQRGSLGMVTMRERTELVDGLLRIDSEEGRGTKISVYVPLSEESMERLHRGAYAL